MQLFIFKPNIYLQALVYVLYQFTTPLLSPITSMPFAL